MTIQGNLLMTIVLLILVMVHSVKTRNIFNPALLFSLPIGLGYILYNIFFQYVWVLSSTALLIYFLGLIGFNIGYFMCCFLETKQHTNKIQNNKSFFSYYYHFESNYFVLLIYAIGVVLNILSINYLNSLGLSGSDLRDTFVVNADSMPFYVIYGKYILMFAVVALLDSALRYKINKAYWVAIIFGTLIALKSALLTQARTDILIIFLPIMTLFAIIKGQNISYYKFFKYSIVTVLCMVGLYYLFKLIQIGRFGSNNASFFSASNQTFQYISLPLVAFDKWIVSANYGGVMHGLGLFELIDKLLKYGGYKFPTFNLAVMGQFNVYGYYKAPFMAFGTIGFFIILVFVGFLCRWIYVKAYSSQFFLLVYVFFADGVMLSFYSWQFFSMVTVYAILFYVIAIATASKIKQKEVNK